jgi:hypothetical protein
VGDYFNKEDLGYPAFSSTDLPLFVILNSFQDNAPNTNGFLKGAAMVVCYPETSSG